MDIPPALIGTGKCSGEDSLTEILTPSHIMLEVGEDLAWDLALHHKLTAVFFLSAEGKREREKVLCHLREQFCHLQLGMVSFACCQCAANQH